MGKTYRAWDVDQGWLLPASVHDFVPAGHPAHFVREVVRESLGLGAILASYEGEERGQPPYHPAMMVALLLYAYSRGLYSSRRIARACEERLDVMAVTAQQRPDFRTISDFRKRHLEALAGLFVQVLELCRAAGLVKLGHVALKPALGPAQPDPWGTKIQANASKHKAMSYGRMQRRERELQAQVTGWLERAAKADAAEEAEHGAARRGDELPAWVADKAARLAKIRAAKAALEAEAAAPLREDDGDGPGPSSGMSDHGRPQRAPDGGPPERAQRNFTDPDSRIQKTRDGFVQGYNAQAAVDAHRQVITACRLTANGADQSGLAPLVEATTTACGRAPREVSGDAGFCSEDNLAALAARKVRGYLMPGRARHGPPGDTGRRRLRPGSRMAAMAAKIRRAGPRSRYRLRKQVVEPVFGQIKGGARLPPLQPARVRQRRSPMDPHLHRPQPRQARHPPAGLNRSKDASPLPRHQVPITPKAIHPQQPLTRTGS